MNKHKILTITIATLTAITITITAAITFTRNANAAETCTTLEDDCHGFYYDLDGIRYNAAGLKEIANDVNEKGTKSKYYDMFIKTMNKNNSGKVLIDNQTYTVYVYRTIPEGTSIINPDENELILHTDNKATDANKKALTFIIEDYSDKGTSIFPLYDYLYPMYIKESQHSSWRDSQLRKIVNTDTFNKLPSELQKQITPTVSIGSYEYSLARELILTGNCEYLTSYKQECDGSNIDKLRYGNAYYYEKTDTEKDITKLAVILFSL